MLADSDAGTLYECPLGKVHRESPHAYDVINVHSMAEGAGFELLQQPRWLQQCFRVVGSEQERHRRWRENERKAKQDAKYGASVLRRR